MEPIVVPKPSLRIFTISTSGMAVRAKKRDARKREMKALSFNLDVRYMMAPILESTKREVVKIFIYYILLVLVLHQ
jgi:hypothetical protein